MTEVTAGLMRARDLKDSNICVRPKRDIFLRVGLRVWGSFKGYYKGSFKGCIGLWVRVWGLGFRV